MERPRETQHPAPSGMRLVTGASLVCLGIALLGRQGVGGTGWLGLNLGAVAVTFAGVALIAARSRITVRRM